MSNILIDEYESVKDTGISIPPAKVIALDNKLANTGADLRDIHLIMGFKKEALEQVFGPNYILFDKITNIREATPESLDRGVISTFHPDSLVNFTYKFFDDNTLDGFIDLVDDGDVFEKFLSRTINNNFNLRFYFCWGYGRNRYHWSSIHQAIIQGITYSIHEGHKLVNIRFTPFPEYTLDNKAITLSVPIFTSQANKNKIRNVSDPRKGDFELEVGEKSIPQLMDDLLKKIASQSYNRLSTFSNKVNVIVDSIDWNNSEYIQYLERLRKSKPIDVIAVRSSNRITRNDLAWMKLTQDFKCLNYQKNVDVSIQAGKVSPDGEFYVQEIVVNPTKENITIQARLDEDSAKQFKRNEVIKKELVLINKELEDLSTIIRSFGPAPGLFGAQIPVELRNARDRNFTLKKKKEELLAEFNSNNKLEKVYTYDKFPLIVYNKPNGVDTIAYFNRLVAHINLKLGTRIKVFFDDTMETPTLFIGETVHRYFKNTERDLLKSNINKNLYGSKKGLRRIRSIITRPRPLETWDTQDLNLNYNGPGGLVETMTIDVVFPEFFKILNRIYQLGATPTNQSLEKISFQLEDLDRLINVFTELYQSYEANDKRPDNQNNTKRVLKRFLDTMKKSRSNITDTENLPKEIIVEFETEILKNVGNYFDTEKKVILRKIVGDVKDLERKFITIQVKLAGIPELDTMAELFYGRTVNFDIYDPILENKKMWMSGKYFIMGLRHDITLSDGYALYLTLHKSINDEGFLRTVDQVGT